LPVLPPTGPPVGTIGSSSGGASIPPPPPPVDESALIRAAIRQFESSYTAKDADAHARVYVGVSKAALQRGFDQMRTQQMTIVVKTIDVRGTTATAQVRRQIKNTPKVGSTPDIDDDRTLVLQKRGAGWVITEVR
jgi:ketosteroid isomerase-like protein